MELGTIIATGIVAVVSALVGGLVPGVLNAWMEKRARRAASREVVADLAGELLEGCERYRSSAEDIGPLGPTQLALTDMSGAPRPDWKRARDDARARLYACAARIAARDERLGAKAEVLVDVSGGRDDDWSGARDAFVAGLSGLAK